MIWYRLFCLLSSTVIMCFDSAAQPLQTTQWVVHEWTIEHPEDILVVQNDADHLRLEGLGIQINLSAYNGQSFDPEGLKDYALHLRNLFNLEDPDPIYPFNPPRIHSLCIGGYVDLSRIIVLAIESRGELFVLHAVFDDDDLDAEAITLQVLRSLIRKEE
jgi:hypothetical protein